MALTEDYCNSDTSDIVHHLLASYSHPPCSALNVEQPRKYCKLSDTFLSNGHVALTGPKMAGYCLLAFASLDMTNEGRGGGLETSGALFDPDGAPDQLACEWPQVRRGAHRHQYKVVHTKQQCQLSRSQSTCRAIHSQGLLQPLPPETATRIGLKFLE